VASLIDITDDLNITRATFQRIATIELEYRHLDKSDVQPVYDDIYQTALCICMRGLQNVEEYKLLQDGIGRIGSFVLGNRYTLDDAIVNAAKVAYVCQLLRNGHNVIHHFNPDTIEEMAEKALVSPMPAKLNKLKKTHPEAFFYLCEIQTIG